LPRPRSRQEGRRIRLAEKADRCSRTCEVRGGITDEANRWSCTCCVRIKPPGSPVGRYRSKKASTSELSWLPSGPLSPGDALDAGRPDTRHRLRSPLFAVAYHRFLLTGPLAGATAARERAAPRAGATHGRSAQRPSLAFAAATAWPSRCHGWVWTGATAGVRRRVANRNRSISRGL
jgi:hypothetical protein